MTELLCAVEFDQQVAIKTMKKIVLLMLLAFVFVTSCSDDEQLVKSGNDGYATVTLDLSGHEKVSRAGEAFNPIPTLGTMRVFLYVFNDGKLIDVQSKQKYDFSSSSSCEFKFRLAKGNYKVAAWADYGESYYKVPTTILEEGNATVSLNDLSVVGSEMKSDAYWGVSDFEFSPTSGSLNLKLARPFGLVKINTTDWTKLADTQQALPSKYAMKIEAPTQLDLLSGNTSGNQKIEIKWSSLSSKPLADGTKELSYDYILAPAGEAALKEFTAQYADDTEQTLYSYSFSNIPVRRNYITNITTNIFTKEGKVNVSVVPEWQTDNVPQKPITDGFNYSQEKADADQPLTITFKANNASALYNYEGDVYLHTGIITADTWTNVPAQWNDNIDKCKMTRLKPNCWSITMEPTIREWYGSGETAVTRLGLIVRSVDGNKKGLADDTFLEVTDNKYTSFQPGEIQYVAMPADVKEGINIKGNQVTFVLYDKDTHNGNKDYAYVLGDFNNWTLSNTETSRMNRDSDKGCWWLTIPDIDVNKEYAFQYYVGKKGEGTIRLADAYSEKILDPYNDKYIPESTYPAREREYPSKANGIVSTFKANKTPYPWKHQYSIKNSDNLMIYEIHLRDFSETSDINGALKKLDYIKDLGVNAVQLMPVQEFDGNDSWGYNPCFYFALDKAYGTPTRYKDFIDACHERGMAVILDVVYNHATGSMPFAKLYWNNSANKTSNLNPWFNVDAPHPHSVFHDFNHESPLVRQFVKRNLEFLLSEYHVDGFRFDLTKGFTQNHSDGNYDQSRINILSDYYQTIRDASSGKAIMILEHFCEDREEEALTEKGMKVWRVGNEAYCQSGMGWQENSGFDVLFKTSNKTLSYGYIGFMESHDEERVAFKALAHGNGDLRNNLKNRMKSMASNAAFFFTIPGPKMIWQFGELGYDISINDGGRTGKKPVHWDYLNNEYRKELHDTYAKLLKLRTSNPELFDRTANFTPYVSVNDWTGGRAITLENNGKKLFVVGNFTSSKQSIAHTIPAGWSKYHNPITEQDENNVGGTKPELAPHSFLIYTNF